MSGFVARTRRYGVLGVAVVAIVCLLTTVPGFASPLVSAKPNDKQRVDRELAEASATLENATARAQQAGVAFAQANKALPGAQERAASAKGSVIAAQVKVGEAQRVATAAQLQLNQAQAQFDQAEAQVNVARQRLSAFARATYTSGDFTAPAMVFAAKGIDQVLAASEYAKSVAATRRTEINRMRVVLGKSGEQRAKVAERKRRAQVANDQAKASLGAAKSEEEKAKKAEQTFVDLTNQRKEALEIAETEKAASQKLYDELQAESARIEQELREAAERAKREAKESGKKWKPPSLPDLPGKPGGKYGFIKPVKGYKTSNFGWRYDPYFHKWQLHAGTDIAAPRDTPIYAVAGGKVVRAGRAGGYGNYTCIFHAEVGGKSLSTCYAHQNSIGVRVGQQVSQGMLIGRVGTTGASTGNHLHFEVRLDGKPVNPLLGWLQL